MTDNTDDSPIDDRHDDELATRNCPDCGTRPRIADLIANGWCCPNCGFDPAEGDDE